MGPQLGPYCPSEIMESLYKWGFGDSHDWLSLQTKNKIRIFIRIRDTLEEQGINVNGLLMSETIHFFPHETSEFC